MQKQITATQGTVHTSANSNRPMLDNLQDADQEGKGPKNVDDPAPSDDTPSGRSATSEASSMASDFSEFSDFGRQLSNIDEDSRAKRTNSRRMRKKVKVSDTMGLVASAALQVRSLPGECSVAIVFALHIVLSTIYRPSCWCYLNALVK